MLPFVPNDQGWCTVAGDSPISSNTVCTRARATLYLSNMKTHFIQAVRISTLFTLPLQIPVAQLKQTESFRPQGTEGSHSSLASDPRFTDTKKATESDSPTVSCRAKRFRGLYGIAGNQHNCPTGATGGFMTTTFQCRLHRTLDGTRRIDCDQQH